MRRTCEPLRLRWSDVDWEKKLIRVFSSKTKKERYVPIFPEIAEPLKKVYGQRNPESDWVIVEACPIRFRYSKDRAEGMKNANLGKGFDDICRKAGLPILEFAGNNMRASCEKDLYSGKYPELRGRIDTIAGILGHSAATALKYYNRYSIEDLERLTDSFGSIFQNDKPESCEVSKSEHAETLKDGTETKTECVKKRVKQEKKRGQFEQGATKPVPEVPCFPATEKTERKTKQKDYPRQDSNL